MVNRREQSGHCRRRRMAAPSSVVRLSTTRLSECLQKGQCTGLPTLQDDTTLCAHQELEPLEALPSIGDAEGGRAPGPQALGRSTRLTTRSWASWGLADEIDPRVSRAAPPRGTRAEARRASTAGHLRCALAVRAGRDRAGGSARTARLATTQRARSVTPCRTLGGPSVRGARCAARPGAARGDARAGDRLTSPFFSRRARSSRSTAVSAAAPGPLRNSGRRAPTEESNRIRQHPTPSPPSSRSVFTRSAPPQVFEYRPRGELRKGGSAAGNSPLPARNSLASIHLKLRSQQVSTVFSLERVFGATFRKPLPLCSQGDHSRGAQCDHRSRQCHHHCPGPLPGTIPAGPGARQ